MLSDAWFDIRSGLIEAWYLHGNAILAGGMLVAVLFMFYLWRSERV
jgi:hypothetical protein